MNTRLQGETPATGKRRTVAYSRLFAENTDGTIVPVADDRPRTRMVMRGLYTDAVAAYSGSIDGDWWLVYVHDLDPPAGEQVPDYGWVLRRSIPTTNLGGQPRTHGWLGTTNAVDFIAHGRVRVRAGRRGVTMTPVDTIAPTPDELPVGYTAH